MLAEFWVLILFPLIGAAFNGLLGKRLSRRLVGLVGCSSVGLSFLVALAAFWRMVQLPAESREWNIHLFRWIESDALRVDVSFLLDPLSMVMILIVSGVSFLIHLYSLEYMATEEGYYRYFAYLNLFVFMMSLLVLADNYVLLFVGWEGVGLCSYLLIGHYLDRKSAGDAAKKAFVVNRVGDVGFILGIFLIFATFGSVRFQEVFQEAVRRFPEGETGFAVLGAITLLLFIGATGKSAQIPLYVWLPDAMEGPTPVSALIHAATMVTAGVYMVARSAPLYSRAPETLALVALVGLTTALLAALLALAQSDIKKVLAYSTISQLGYMFLALGVGAFGTAIFHVMTHAFFKALLFLGAGSVILALHHEQNLFRMGGLRRHLPVTCWTMVVATLAISGVFPLAGFFSKDEILWKVFEAGHPLMWLLGVTVAALTALYMFRLLFLAFWGKERFELPETTLHPAVREGGFFLKLPLLVLALFSVASGWLGLPAYLGPNHLEGFLRPSFRLSLPALQVFHSHSLEILLSLGALGAAGAGIYLAWRAYLVDPSWPVRLAHRFPSLFAALREKFYVDQFYDALLVWPTVRLAERLLWRFLDVRGIDGAVNGTAQAALSWSSAVRRWQAGYIRVYAVWLVGGAALILLYYLLAFG